MNRSLISSLISCSQLYVVTVGGRQSILCTRLHPGIDPDQGTLSQVWEAVVIIKSDARMSPRILVAALQLRELHGIAYAAHFLQEYSVHIDVTLDLLARTHPRLSSLAGADGGAPVDTAPSRHQAVF